tara:strand:- start:1065 stop:1490 length:426 start_codon:yes stop_codon:yes gene_type:complete
MPLGEKKYINLFKETDIIDGIRVNVNSLDKAFAAIKEMFQKKPNIIYGIEDYKVEKYDEIVSAFRKWLITNEINISFDKKKLVKQIFQFHSQTMADHVVAFQSYNLDTSLLMCRVNKKFINIEIPKISGIPYSTSIIATYS